MIKLFWHLEVNDLHICLQNWYYICIYVGSAHSLVRIACAIYLWCLTLYIHHDVWALDLVLMLRNKWIYSLNYFQVMLIVMITILVMKMDWSLQSTLHSSCINTHKLFIFVMLQDYKFKELLLCLKSLIFIHESISITFMCV